MYVCIHTHIYSVWVCIYGIRGMCVCMVYICVCLCMVSTYVCMCVYVCVREGERKRETQRETQTDRQTDTSIIGQVWRTEDDAVESVLSFHHYVGHGTRTQVVRLT